MAEKQGAYGKAAADTSFRRTWDKDEYRKQAEEKDAKAREHAQEAEQALRKGKKPPKRRRDEDLPKPTEKMKAREGSLELDKNLNKTMVVAAGGGRGPGQPGFYCDVCNRTLKDSVGYLDHLNSRSHLRHLGQTTRQSRSTLNQVRAKIAALRESTAAKAQAKQIDFDQRLRDIRAAEEVARQERKEQKKKAKAEPTVIEGMEVDQDMASMMGFGSFGGGVRA